MFKLLALFQIEGLIEEIAFCPMFDLRKGFLSLKRYFLCLAYNLRQIQKFKSDNMGKCYWQNIRL